MNGYYKRIADDLTKIAEGLRDGSIHLSGYTTSIKNYVVGGYSSKDMSIHYVEIDKEPK